MKKNTPIMLEDLVIILQNMALEYAQDAQWDYDSLSCLEKRAKSNVCSDLAKNLVALKHKAEAEL